MKIAPHTPFIALAVIVGLGSIAHADLATELASKGAVTKTSEWQGYPRLDFALPDDGASCIVIAPKKAAEGKPWIWRARFFGHQPALDTGLLERGWHVCYCNIGGLFGAPKAVERWDKFHKLATGLGLSQKPVLEGMSRGGLIIFNWASANPDKVRAIYGDNPVCDFTSWPGGKGLGKGSDGDWKKCLAASGNDEAAATTAQQPNDKATLKPIAAKKIPVFIVIGEADKVVPVAENADPLAAAYRELGGPVKVWRKPGLDHHPHGLSPVEPLLEAILATE
jgi:pimeloyl-ACP methyl ester carboxylesterase